MSDEGISSNIEIERKYDVDAAAAIPAAVGLGRTTPGGVESLHATYYDTPDGALAANAITLRVRAGGHDAGWHLKLPRQGERMEHHAQASTEPPAGLLALVSHITEDRPIAIAIVDTRRLTARVTDGEGRGVAEIADDLVSTVDLRSGVKRTWREWEVELINEALPDLDSGTALLDEIEASLLSSGATPSRYNSKLARALGRTSLR